jgi:hypothetical protein
MMEGSAVLRRSAAGESQTRTSFSDNGLKIRCAGAKCQEFIDCSEGGSRTRSALQPTGFESLHRLFLS